MFKFSSQKKQSLVKRLSTTYIIPSHPPYASLMELPETSQYLFNTS